MWFFRRQEAIFVRKIAYFCNMILKANCKINIGLDILAKRPDGFHEVQTVMYPVSGLYDTLHITPNGSGRSRLTVKGLAIDCPEEDNICLKACRIMRERFETEGVDILLEKRVPFGAGLGGGSSDATAVLLAHNELFSLGLSAEQLEVIAAELGSDTSFFVRNIPRLCTGRGEILSPTDVNLDGMTLVVVKPDDFVSTREAYAGVVPAKPLHALADSVRRPVGEWTGVVKNDFEPHIFKAHPRIGELKSALLSQGALYAAMSGSGSAVFGIFDGEASFTPPFEGLFVHVQRL